jgi:hypothetical protein
MDSFSTRMALKDIAKSTNGLVYSSTKRGIFAFVIMLWQQ